MFAVLFISLQSSVKAKLLAQHVARHLAGQEINVSFAFGQVTQQ